MKWLLLLTIASSAHANRAVMEGLTATNNTILPDTTNGRVDVATSSYNGTIANVGLHVSSNVVIDSGSGLDAIVIYSTGSIMANGVKLSSGSLPSLTAAFTGIGTQSSPIGINSSSVPVYGSGQNLTVPYGFQAATMTITGAGGTSPPATFVPNLSSSTTSGNLSGTFMNTTLAACVSGSTITLTLPANVGKIMVGLNGTISVNSLQPIMVGVLVDGAFVNGESSTVGLIAPIEQTVLDGNNVSFAVPITGLSAATHNICLVTAVGSGTATIDSTNSAMRLWAYMLP